MSLFARIPGSLLLCDDTRPEYAAVCNNKSHRTAAHERCEFQDWSMQTTAARVSVLVCSTGCVSTHVQQQPPCSRQLQGWTPVAAPSEMPHPSSRTSPPDGPVSLCMMPLSFPYNTLTHACTRARARVHAHTHTHTQREREREREQTACRSLHQSKTGPLPQSLSSLLATFTVLSCTAHGMRRRLPRPWAGCFREAWGQEWGQILSAS